MSAGESGLAPYAVQPGAGREREHREPPDPLRSPFVLDRHRIVACTAFRRLEGKTQVFLAGRHDHFRTRLTHTLEVTDIARCLAVALRVEADLVEAIALAHDLGHPPFGHAGESALDEAMADFGGFNHNAHSLRVVEFLEHPFPPFRGLNLTAAVRAGLRTHATQYDRPAAPEAPSIEAQAASWADRIAYACHDLEDCLGAELYDDSRLADWLREECEIWREAATTIVREWGERPLFSIRRPILDAMLSGILADVVTTTCQRLQLGERVVACSAGMESRLGELESFLRRRLYHHAEVAEMDRTGRRWVLELFEAYRRDPNLLPRRFADRIDELGRERVIADYIAGMTDRFCQREHEKVVAKPKT